MLQLSDDFNYIPTLDLGNFDSITDISLFIYIFLYLFTYLSAHLFIYAFTGHGVPSLCSTSFHRSQCPPHYLPLLLPGIFVSATCISME
jgi:hypothetical protein